MLLWFATQPKGVPAYCRCSDRHLALCPAKMPRSTAGACCLHRTVCQVNETLSARSQRLHELEATLATETVATAKYRKMVRRDRLPGKPAPVLTALLKTRASTAAYPAIGHRLPTCCSAQHTACLPACLAEGGRDWQADRLGAIHVAAAAGAGRAHQPRGILLPPRRQVCRAAGVAFVIERPGGSRCMSGLSCLFPNLTTAHPDRPSPQPLQAVLWRRRRRPGVPPGGSIQPAAGLPGLPAILSRPPAQGHPRHSAAQSVTQQAAARGQPRGSYACSLANQVPVRCSRPVGRCSAVAA